MDLSQIPCVQVPVVSRHRDHMVNLDLVIRLYSEIDHLHPSTKAQCVSHLVPLGDCHSGSSYRLTIHSIFTGICIVHLYY